MSEGQHVARLAASWRIVRLCVAAFVYTTAVSYYRNEFGRSDRDGIAGAGHRRRRPVIDCW